MTDVADGLKAEEIWQCIVAGDRRKCSPRTEQAVVQLHM